MSIQEKQQPQVNISGDGMEAYLKLSLPHEGETYTVEELKALLQTRGICAGIDEKTLEMMVKDNIFEREVRVARGVPPVDGVDGCYEYNFRSELDKKPKIRSDGTVDYWSMNLIETVMEGQVIAIYKPAVQGQPGVDVRGKVVTEKRGKELPPLKGKGFERENDNLTYIASISGKIDVHNERIMILPIYEIYGNVDLSVGNVDFIGDVMIHGNVCTGVQIKATGTITIDGVVEGANLWAGKDIVLRSGMLGGNKATVYAKENLYAKFFEYTSVETLGNIEADVFLNSEINCHGKIVMSGKRAKIIGGYVDATYGIEVNDLGNVAEAKTSVSVGVGSAETVKLTELYKKIAEDDNAIQKLERSLAQFQVMEEQKGISYKDDPRRMQLLRERIRYTAMKNADQAEAEQLKKTIDNARGVSIKVIHNVYPGVFVKMGDLRLTVKDMQSNMEFINRVDHIVMLRIDEKIVV